MYRHEPSSVVCQPPGIGRFRGELSPINKIPAKGACLTASGLSAGNLVCTQHVLSSFSRRLGLYTTCSLGVRACDPNARMCACTCTCARYVYAVCGGHKMFFRLSGLYTTCSLEVRACDPNARMCARMCTCARCVCSM